MIGCFSIGNHSVQVAEMFVGGDDNSMELSTEEQDGRRKCLAYDLVLVLDVLQITLGELNGVYD